MPTSATGANGNYHIHMDGWSPTAIGTLPLGPVELFAEAGYLFYDVNGIEAPLSGGSLLVRGIELEDGTMLSDFEAKFSKYLAAKRK